MSFELFKSQVLKTGAKAVKVGLTDTKSIADAMSEQLKAEGREEKDYSIEKDLEAKAALLETKANEIMHTGNTGYGAELVPGSILMTDFLDMAPKVNPLLASFRGFHGKGLAMIEERPVIGELPLHDLMPEQTTGALAFAQGKGKLPTAKVTLTQKQYFFSVDISEAEARFSVVDLLALIKNKLANSSARTMIAAIVNGDTETGANANINSIDGTPAGTEYYLGGNGLRKKALASAATSFDLGTLDFTDFLTLRKALGENGTPEDLVYIFGTAANTKALGVAEFLQAYINGSASTALTGKLPPFLGSEVATQRYLGLANANGKVATTTPANNTKGQILCVHKDAVQYGFNGDYSVEIYRVPGKGYQVIGWYFMGYDIASGLAGTDPTVSLGYNVTV